MEEQRIKSLEDELKVLKNQIRAVLLDIKEQLATGGNGQSGAAPWVGTIPAVNHQEGEIKVVPEHAAGPKPAAEGKASDRVDTDKDEFDIGSMMNRRGVAGVATMTADTEGRVDLLTVSVLAQWLSRAAAIVSKEQISKLVEIYDITGNLPPRLKQTILLLADLYSNGNGKEDAQEAPATVSIQLLIELDSLLRYRTGALESVVLSMLLDKGQNDRRGG